MQEEFEHICQLLTSDDENNCQIALQILKGNPILAEKVKIYFTPILTASKKKTLTALPTIMKQLKRGKGTMKARLAIGTLPELFPSITALYINNQPLKEIPEWIGQLSNLGILALSGCQLSQLPNWIGQLTNLTFLSIAGNQIQEIPDTLGNLTKLNCCYLIDNQIQALPNSIVNLTLLKNFYIKKGNSIPSNNYKKIVQLLPDCRVH